MNFKLIIKIGKVYKEKRIRTRNPDHSSPNPFNHYHKIIMTNSSLQVLGKGVGLHQGPVDLHNKDGEKKDKSLHGREQFNLTPGEVLGSSRILSLVFNF